MAQDLEGVGQEKCQKKFCRTLKLNYICSPDLRICFFDQRTRNVHLRADDSCEKVNDSVAQPVEHYTFNVGVLGSNPSGITGKCSKTL